MGTEKLLDDIGWMILAELQRDARLSWSELGRRVGLTPPAVADRVRHLEEAGVISGYRAVIDRAAVGRPITALIRIRPAPGEEACRLMVKVLEESPDVVACHRITGSECYHAQVAVESVDGLERLLDSLLPYGETTTSMVLSSPVESRPLGPPPAD